MNTLMLSISCNYNEFLQLLAVTDNLLIKEYIPISLLSSLVTSSLNEDIGDKLELMLIRVGYVSEGVIKGSIVAVPTSLLVLLAFNSVMKLQDRVK